MYYSKNKMLRYRKGIIMWKSNGRYKLPSILKIEYKIGITSNFAWLNLAINKNITLESSENKN